jgi:hypothetical protein
MLVTSIGTRQATARTQIHKLIDSWANQVRTNNVYRRMFDRLREGCRRFLGRARELFAKLEFCRELTARRLPPRWTAGIVMVLSLASLAHRTGVPVQTTDRSAPFSLISVWKAAERDVIRLQNRVREDYQSLQLVYQVARRIRNLPGQPEICEQQVTPRLDRCRVTEQGREAKDGTTDRAAQAMAWNRLRCSFSLD